MELGNAAWGLRELSIEEKLQITSAMGLKLLELSIAGHGNDFLQTDATTEKIAEVKRLFAKYGIRPICGCTGNDFMTEDAAQLANEIQTVCKVVDIASQAGVKYLRIFAGFSSDSIIYGARFQQMLEAMRKVAGYAASRDVILAVETHGGVKKIGDAVRHCASVTTRCDLWPAILKTGVFMLYDPANLAAVGDGDPTMMYRKYKDSVAVIHLKDFRSVNEEGVLPVACGEGRLDWKALKTSLNAYQGPALFEYENPGDVEDGLRRSLRIWNAI